jgi:ribosomal protein S27E
MRLKCGNCGTLNEVPENTAQKQVRCGKCGAFLPKGTQPLGDTSEAVGLIGGAALGAAIAGPVGAIVGAIVGALVGREAKGVG